MQEHLIHGEKVIRVFSPKRKGYFWFYFFAVFTCWTFFIPLILILVVEIEIRAKKYIITNKRVISDYTFIQKQSSSAELHKITDVYLKQGLMDRVFNVGSLEINTAGSNKKEIIIERIETPFEIKKLIVSKRSNNY